MIVEFSFNEEFEKTLSFFGKEFPEIDLQIGQTIWFHDFEKFLQKGQIYYPDEHADFGEFDDVSGLAKIVNIIHGFNEHGCIKIISVESM